MEIEVTDEAATAAADAATLAAAEASAAAEAAAAAAEGATDALTEDDDASIVELAETLGELRTLAEQNSATLAAHAEAHARILAAIDRLSARIEELNAEPESGTVVVVPDETLPPAPEVAPETQHEQPPPEEQPEHKEAKKRRRHFV